LSEIVGNADLKKYLRTEGLPSLWCAGCGIGTVVGAMLRAIDSLKIPQEDVVIATGIGCSGWIYNYLRFDGYHGTHGRALPAATGIKAANPKLNVIVPMGDGDCAAIGANHLVQAARRNIDLTAIVVNNEIYGMTGGQYSPTTPFSSYATTAPYGHTERPFDLCGVAMASGATYVARGTTFHARQLAGLIAKGISHKGFSFIEVISQCPTQFGRRNKMAKPSAMIDAQKKASVSVEAAAKMTPAELKGKWVIGELLNKVEPEWIEEYAKVIQRAQERLKNE
jgi:2-oxoglutarate/2-oxoacid ferredoxin oxidoreductase subunit beta